MWQTGDLDGLLPVPHPPAQSPFSSPAPTVSASRLSTRTCTSGCAPIVLPTSEEALTLQNGTVENRSYLVLDLKKILDFLSTNNKSASHCNGLLVKLPQEDCRLTKRTNDQAPDWNWNDPIPGNFLET